jgi:hypothetical protein
VLADIGKIAWGTDIPTVPSHEWSLIRVGRATEKALKRIQKNAKHERTEYLRTHRECLALRVTPKDTEVAIQTIDRQWANKCMFVRIQSAVKTLSSAALPKVELVEESIHVHPVSGTEVKLRQVQTIHTKRKLGVAIIARNKRHFAQACGC